MRVSVLIILLCLLLASTGCLGKSGSFSVGLTAEEAAVQQSESAAADALDKAMQLYHDGEFLEPDAAFEYLNEAVELDPTLVVARYQRAVLYLDRQQIDDALADVNAILEVRPDYAKALYVRALIMMHKKDYPGAVRDFSRVIEDDNTIADAYARRGTCYANQDRFKDAINDFSRALAINPAHVKANYNRGMAYMALGDYESAVHDLTQAVTLDSQSYDIIMARAAAYMKLARYDRAEADFRRAIVLEPSRSGLYALLGETLAGTGDIKGAIQAVKTALILSRAEDNPKAVVLYQEQLDEYLTKPASIPAPAAPAAPAPVSESAPDVGK
ncbi:MAG: tetratricopeptide repeat protein [Pseudodesulfovibrio sp.]|nr:tetratricopeptide repeat protein [Pseudodesulfovibrio sp.]